MDSFNLNLDYAHNRKVQIKSTRTTSAVRRLRTRPFPTSSTLAPICRTAAGFFHDKVIHNHSTLIRKVDTSNLINDDPGYEYF